MRPEEAAGLIVLAILAVVAVVVAGLIWWIGTLVWEVLR